MALSLPGATSGDCTAPGTRQSVPHATRRREQTPALLGRAGGQAAMEVGDAEQGPRQTVTVSLLSFPGAGHQRLALQKVLGLPGSRHVTAAYHDVYKHIQ